MPRECIPQDEFIWLHAKLQQCAPHNRRGRFRKPVRTFLRSAGAARPVLEENIAGLKLEFLTSSEQQALRGHGDSGEVTATITNRFADDCDLRASKAFLQVSA